MTAPWLEKGWIKFEQKSEGHIYTVWIKSNGIKFDISEVALFTGVQHLCTFNIVASLLSPSSKCLGGVVHLTASIFVNIPYWLPYSMDKFISCVVPGPSQWFFHFGKEILNAWTHTGWVRWMFHNLPLATMQEVHDSSSGVNPCIVMKNDGVLCHQMLHAVPNNILVYYDIVPLQFWSRNVALVL